VNVELEQTRDDQEKLGFVARCSGATFFHLPAWLAALESSFPRFTARWITARSGTELVGLMPVVEMRRGPFRFLMALPFGTYGHPLAPDGAVRGELLGLYVELSAARRCLESEASLFDGVTLSALPPSWAVRMQECSLIELTGSFEDFRRDALSSKRRQLCNRGLRAGVRVRELESEREVRDFHAIYAVCSRDWGGVHPYPLRFFLELWKRRDAGVVFWGGFLGGRLLGGNIDFYFGRMAQAWQAGISPEAYRYSVGSLLVTAAVEEAYRRGCRTFNLGSSGGDEGMIFFKRSFGGSEYLYPVLEMKRRWWGWLRKR
jgi:CelD/BcsL family acetyltransferase involved in cellulose biosynthesis